MSELKIRTFTGFWIVLFVLGGLWLHPLSFVLIGLIMLAGSQYEYYKLVSKNGIKPQVITGMITGILVYIVATVVSYGSIPLSAFMVLIPVFSVIAIIELYRKQKNPFGNLAHTFFGVLYIAIPFSLLPFSAFGRIGLETLIPFSKVVFSPGIMIGFFLLHWANDTGAYLVGVNFGRNRLFKRISPKKSWEGFIAGVVISLIVAWLISEWLGVVGRFSWIIIALIISVVGTFGDLIESMLKRSIEAKDSGTILPGHGGFLDRFDSVIFSLPLVYLYIALFA